MNLKTKSENKKSACQLSLMIILTLLSQILALYKSRFTATSFGATNYMDAYNFALNIATFLFAFVTTGVTTVIIPAYVKKTDKKAVNSFITINYYFKSKCFEFPIKSQNEVIFYRFLVVLSKLKIRLKSIVKLSF